MLVSVLIDPVPGRKKGLPSLSRSRHRRIGQLACHGGCKGLSCGRAITCDRQFQDPWACTRCHHTAKAPFPGLRWRPPALLPLFHHLRPLPPAAFTPLSLRPFCRRRGMPLPLRRRRLALRLATRNAIVEPRGLPMLPGPLDRLAERVEIAIVLIVGVGQNLRVLLGHLQLAGARLLRHAGLQHPDRIMQTDSGRTSRRPALATSPRTFTVPPSISQTVF